MTKLGQFLTNIYDNYLGNESDTNRSIGYDLELGAVMLGIFPLLFGGIIFTVGSKGSMAFPDSTILPWMESIGAVIVSFPISVVIAFAVYLVLGAINQLVKFLTSWFTGGRYEISPNHLIFGNVVEAKVFMASTALFVITSILGVALYMMPITTILVAVILAASFFARCFIITYLKVRDEIEKKEQSNE